MKEPRLRVKPKDRGVSRNRASDAQYTAWYRFRTGYIRVPKQCRQCGSVFYGHRCGGAEVITVTIDVEAFTYLEKP